MRCLYFCLSFTLWGQMLIAQETFKTKKYKEIETKLRKDSWIVTDLDNTVFTPDLINSQNQSQAEEACDAFFYKNQKQKTLELGLKWATNIDSKIAKWLGYRAAVDAWNRVISEENIILKPVEKSTPKVLEKLLKEHVVIGLTARESCLQKATENALKRLNINFSQLSEKIEFVGTEQDPLQKRSVLWSNGVYYVGRGFGSPHHKGVMFLELMKKLKRKPEHVIFIDDRKEHCIGMKIILEAAHISVDAFEYQQMSALE